MRRIGLQISLLIGMGGLLGACSPKNLDRSAAPLPVAVSPSPKPTKALEYQRQVLPNSIVHTLLIPADSPYQVIPAIAEKVATVEQFAQGYGAIAVLNGGFFDPSNQKSTSSVIVQGKRMAVPENNERLMGNPDLLPYLDKILNRSEFRRYRCGNLVSYAIAPRQSLPTAGCQIADALGAGPQLLPEMTLVPEGFLDRRNGKSIRDVLGSTQRNARTAVGITQDGSVIWVMVAQKPNAPGDSGMTLQELTDFLKTLNVQSAMNLDGGSSSALFYAGQTVLGKVHESGQAGDRPVKSVLLVLPNKN